MSTELVANIKNLSFQDLAQMTGAFQETTSYLPRLKINREAEDEQGNSLPMGAFCVSQEGNTVYSKEATFRLFINAYQYQEYDPTLGFVNKSVIIKSFNEEAFDELGGLACGKISRDRWDSLPVEEQLRQRNIKCNRLMFGTVSFTVPQLASNDPGVTDLPVVWRLAGSNFMAPKDALAIITKARHQFFNHNLELSTKRQKTGSTIYYEAIVKPDMTKTIELTKEDIATFSLFQENIDRENGFVMSKWKSVKKQATKASDKELLKTLDLNDPIDDVL